MGYSQSVGEFTSGAVCKLDPPIYHDYPLYLKSNDCWRGHVLDLKFDLSMSIQSSCILAFLCKCDQLQRGFKTSFLKVGENCPTSLAILNLCSKKQAQIFQNSALDVKSTGSRNQCAAERRLAAYHSLVEQDLNFL